MFRTPINIPESPVKITHKTPVFLMGSCFSDCMGNRFYQNKFDVMANPFGTVYNPVSIVKQLNYALTNTSPEANSYTETHGLIANFDFHSSFSAPDAHDIATQLTENISQAHHFLKRANWVVITFGTAFVYERVDNGHIVANCHKLPANQFSKRLLTTDEIEESMQSCIEQLARFNPKLNLLFTVSPVRHIKETLQANSVSKSILRVACAQLASQFDRVHYFPSFEIMLDDLRDYRFYRSDMIHPNEEAEGYIWDQFAACYFDPETKRFLTTWKKIVSAMSHKPFNPASEKHQLFLQRTIEQLRRLDGKIDIQEELAILEAQLLS